MIDDKVIDQIVGEVLAQLRQRIGTAPDSSTTNGQTKPDAPASGAKSTSIDVIELNDAVITAETLKQKAKPGATIRLASRAIITPSAKDYIRSQKLSLSRERQNGRPAAVGSKGSGTIIAAHLPGVVQSFIADVKRSKSWAVEMESGTDPVVDRVRSVICRGESKQALVFVKNPHRVACLVNRNVQCRAAVVQSGTDVGRVRSELGANVICVDLRQPTFVGLREILRASEQSLDLIQEFQGS